ncbi:nitrilase-related carbon-nitrogen hydrolase [Roseateles sp. DC23W]|uniref:Nitrilase-related carbon-nitrogen hydrolase n=1 Tax=Pelomonas dachongensis TaxID=3299029 RepID=A0ABW7EI72_9BURK
MARPAGRFVLLVRERLSVGLLASAGAGGAMGAAYLAPPSPLTAALLLGGMTCAAWQLQQATGRHRWYCCVLTLLAWQVGGMGWITAVLSPALAGLERAVAIAALFSVLWLVSLGSLLALAWLALRLLPGRVVLALPLAWWAWLVLRDLCWWGGGYGSLSLPLLALPGLATLLPVLGTALFEALLWAALLWVTAVPVDRRGEAGSRRVVAAGLAEALGWPLPWAWTAPAGSVPIAAVPTPPAEPATAVDGWTLQARDAALAALHRAIQQAPAGSLIVTPEIFLPEPPPPATQGVWGDLLMALDARQQRLLLGTALPHPEDRAALMNVALLLAPQRGEVSASVYAKQRLAPIGEELPWPGLLAPIADRWLNHSRRIGRRAAPPELAEPLLVDGASLGVLLCHEVAFGDLPAARADALLHLASDRWSGDPRSARQALGLARLRALETGKWLLSVSEGEAAQLIDLNGHARPARPQEVLPLLEGATPFIRWRDLQPVAPFVLLAALLPACRRRRTRAGPHIAAGATP